MHSEMNLEKVVAGTDIGLVVVQLEHLKLGQVV